MNEIIKNFFNSVQPANLVAMISILLIFYTRLDSKMEKSSSQLDSNIEKSITKMDCKTDKAIAYLEEKIDKSTAQLESRIERIYVHMDQIEHSVTELDKRLCRIEGSLAVHSYCATHRQPEALPE